ncbi:hypothetical protein T440DRAFT_387141 [Plenodomus tracheiphilus IPT5]|uniref:Uncharacterized protein n=1 Tax=Plenodomus tracheiphilus IPT5 TaxID=1408161 RepID=A0A6A7BJB9_9PLEO|nr:hypothetical protein T440DRAFT_387141 [Plenodomus tracheiphilus IPT5]
MGREAYLDKIAFGRSAFTPTPSATTSNEYIQLESSQSEVPQRYLEATANNYIQLYDERGNPINPRSREYGKKLRSAQNDVLASVGVVQRRQSPAHDLPGSYKERLELLETEDSVGNVIAVAAELTENLCTWWIGSIRARLMTYRYLSAAPFTSIISDELATGGASLIYAGFPARLCATSIVQTMAHGAVVYQPLARLLNVTRASTKARLFFRRSQGILKLGLRWAVELLLYPLSYHARLQRLGLVPATMLLPALSSLSPWSASSPLSPISVHYNASTSMSDCILALLTSPMVLVCAEHLAERWAYACIHEAIDTCVIRPENADLPSRQADDKEWVATILGRRQSPPVIRNLISRVMHGLGWGRPVKSDDVEPQRVLFRNSGHMITVGGTQVANIRPLEIPAFRDPGIFIAEPVDVGVGTMSDRAANEITRAATPPTPGLLAVDAADSDPRIRITSREGIVEMEVRLPPRVLSTHSELAEVSAFDPETRTAVFHEDLPKSSDRLSHRVTQLSMELASMVGAITEAQLIGLALLPLQIMTCRLVAAHYLASCKAQGSLPHSVRALLDMKDMSWRSVGTQISRIALCAALELSIDLGLWGVQYFVVTNIGQALFGWGTL